MVASIGAPLRSVPSWFDFAIQAAECGRVAARRGKVSRQIPALRDVDTSYFGLAISALDGTEITVGEAEERFSLQSLTKLFALVALLERDPRAWRHVGWGASQAGYNSVSEVELHHGRPRNPFVNAGALVVTDRLLQHTGDAVHDVSALLTSLSSESVHQDPTVARSEALTDHRNRAIAHVLAENGRLLHDVDTVLTQYFSQCAIAASALAIARSARFLADRSSTRSGPLDVASARRVNAVLLMAGMYGEAGDIAYRIGLPAKSGIGGGVLAVMPRVGAICAWSPPLDGAGNSVGAVVAIEKFAELAGWSVF